MPTVADGVTEVFPANRIAVRSVPVGEFTNSFAIRPFYSGPDASQWGGLEPSNMGPSAADQPRGGRGPIGRFRRKKRKLLNEEQLRIFRSFKSRMVYLGAVSGAMAGPARAGGFRNLGKGSVLKFLRELVKGKPRVQPRLRVDAPPPQRISPRGRLRSQGGYIDPALLGGGPARRIRPRRGSRSSSSIPQPRSLPDGPTGYAVPRPLPPVRPLPLPAAQPGALPGALPAPSTRPRTAPQPRTAPRPAPQARPTPAGRPDALAKIRKSAAAAAQRAAGVARGRLISKAAGIGTKAAGARKFMTSLLKPPRAAPFTLRFSRPQLGRSAQLLRDPFQVQGLTPVQQPQLALQPEPAMPGDRRRIRSSRGTRCPDRKGRKKGLCQQGYFRETPDGITYTKWSERKCQASSRKKPPSPPAR